MYLEPCAKIEAGALTFINFRSIVIEESVKELGGKATVTLPRNYAKLNGKSVLELIKTGDPVTIWLGYDGKLEKEFTGYIREIESEAPLVLYIDDDLYPLKRTNFKKAWKSVTLKELLQFIAPGYEVNCPGVNLGAFQIANVSAFRVLMDIQNTYGLYTIVRGKTLTCQFPYDIKGTGQMHTYTFYTPTVKKSNLKYKRAEDNKVRVRVTSKQRNGKTLKVEVGAKEGEGSVYETSLPTMSESELKTFAENWYKKLCFDGYQGSITGFGTPRTKAGDTLKIVDKEEPDREGNYLIESVTITYDLTVGFERENKLSFKV
ncbi:hypothetical protein [Acetobacteroides hydrogenigenes]|uniref:Phage protein D n=1 Tax=Acetobacteroides hydrogenigenes TaxID=979970 RepID=A0A4R2EHR1_9BACT|nr:hypothetical protein [Acetobacteroides hydrogenigenes]TCN63679.1 phage protein D [Acetobacteroides hydrogenigenes]